MPYIEQEHRTPELEAAINNLVKEANAAGATMLPGVLNYIIFAFIKRLFNFPSRTKYGSLHFVTGVLINVKDEIYRRFAAPYEDEKIVDNGDVE